MGRSEKRIKFVEDIEARKGWSRWHKEIGEGRWIAGSGV